MNWPLKADDGDGLRILQDENGSLNVTDPLHAETPSAVDKADLVISSFDYGAWGTLRVTAADEDGRSVNVRVRGKQVPDLDIPLDANGNRIADAWEKKKDVWRKQANADDEDEPLGNNFPGDGLTLYEEYRGFTVQGDYVQGEPKKEDSCLLLRAALIALQFEWCKASQTHRALTLLSTEDGPRDDSDRYPLL